jgi:hypothetical protein
MKLFFENLQTTFTTTVAGFNQTSILFQVPNIWVAKVDMEVFAKQVGGFNAGYWLASGLIAYNNSAQLVAAGVTITPTKSAGAVNWDFRARIVGASSITFDVAGDAGMTVDWLLNGNLRGVQ